MKTPHLFFISSEYPQPGKTTGGIGIVNATLAREFARRGWGVDACVFAGKKSYCTMDESVRVQFYPSRIGSFIGAGFLARAWFRFRLRQRINAASGAIVEISDYDAAILPGGIRAPVVLRFHNSDVYAYSRRLKGSEKVLSQQSFEKRVRDTVTALRQAKACVFTCRYCRDHFAGTFKAELPAKVAIIYNPVNLDFYIPHPGSTVAGRVVYAGSLLEKKGIIELAEAWVKVSSAKPDATLVMAGRVIGNDVKLFCELLPEQVRSRIVFPGHRDQDEMRDLLRSAQVCVFPSHWEAQGMAPLEAMACGKPVIFAKDFSGPDLISDGIDGILVDTYSSGEIAGAILKLLNDQLLCDKLGMAARETLTQRFSLEEGIRKNIELYRSLVANNTKQKRKEI